MHTDSSGGFSAVKFLLIFLAIMIIVAGGITAAYFIVRQMHTAEAQAVARSITEDIQSNNPKAAFDDFSATLKGEDQNTAYSTWYFWVSSFNDDSNKVTLNTDSESILYNEASVLNVLSSNETIRFTYKTSHNALVYFDVKKSEGKWVLNDYAAL